MGAPSYVFDGESGYLDHALASPTLAAQVSGVAEWHINPDEPTVLDYNTNIQTFPSVIIAGMFGFLKREFFDAEPAADAVPTVDLSLPPRA